MILESSIVAEFNKGIAIKVLCNSYKVSQSSLYSVDWIELYSKFHLTVSKKTVSLQEVYQLERRLESLEHTLQIFQNSGCGLNSPTTEKFKAIDSLVNVILYLCFARR